MLVNELHWNAKRSNTIRHNQTLSNTMKYNQTQLNKAIELCMNIHGKCECLNVLHQKFTGIFTFHGKKTFRLVGGSLSWSETPYFHKGGPLRMGPSCLWSPKCKKTTFFSNSNILWTNWLTYQKWVLDWKLLWELNCNFWASHSLQDFRKNEKARGQICPPPPPALPGC